MSNKSTILIIGNMSNPDGSYPTDGGTVKILLYEKKIKEEGHYVLRLDLQGWKRHIINRYFLLLKYVRKANVVLLMAGPNGSRILAPLIAMLKKRHKYRAIFVPLGTGVFDNLFMKSRNPHLAAIEAIENNNYDHLKDKNMGKHLKKFDYILLQNNQLTNLYTNFYSLENCFTLNNFRDISNRSYVENEHKGDILKLVYISRITEDKGIIDLVRVVSDLNKGKAIIQLNIYGEKNLTASQNLIFTRFLDSNIIYNGKLPNDEVVDTIKRNDFVILPTKYHGEGTPGILIESLLAGTPIILSSYSQYKSIMPENGIYGYVFKINDLDSLKNTLLNAISNRNSISVLRKNAYEEGSKYTYSYNRSEFLKYITEDK